MENYQITNYRDRRTPENDDVSEFTTYSRDGIRIEGWGYKPPKPQGTIFQLHGYCGHCSNPETVKAGFDLVNKFGVALIAYDSRGHGLSEDHIPTFGTAEMWDFQSVLSYAEKNGFPKPFIAIGDSMGAMVAQRTAISDGRIAGAIMQNTPAYPHHAIGISTIVGGPLFSSFINMKYGWDILGDGDIRNISPNPDHHPYIYYIVGDKDHFDWEKTYEVYEHWYSDCKITKGENPCKDPDAIKWFQLIDGATHSIQRSPYNIYHWPNYWETICCFISKCLKEKSW